MLVNCILILKLLHFIDWVNTQYAFTEMDCDEHTFSLTALKRSKSRVQEVITTELPSLLHKELLSKEGSDVTKKTTAELHRTRWMKLFNKMEQGLSEEEQLLVSPLFRLQIASFYSFLFLFFKRENNYSSIYLHGISSVHCQF